MVDRKTKQLEIKDFFDEEKELPEWATEFEKNAKRLRK